MSVFSSESFLLVQRRMFPVQETRVLLIIIIIGTGYIFFGPYYYFFA